ncbi:SurA N-terminal domain-containing protein [soil metagenome]
MFDFVRRHTRLLQFLLVLLIFPSFVFLGVQGYMQSNGGEDAVAKVGPVKITQAEWDQAQRSQMERLRAQMPNISSEMLNTPAFRRQVLDELVRERVMLQAADRLHLVTTDDRLHRVFTTDPQFEFLRNADGSVNKTALAAQGMSSEQFAMRLRQDLSMRQVVLGLSSSVIAPPSLSNGALDAMFQQREIQVQRFDAKDYVSKVNPSDADIDKYYNDPVHGAQFQAPEAASVQYVVLDLPTIKAGITVSDEELRKNYEQNQSRYATPEERRASHILFKADKSMSAQERAKAKAQADSVLAELKKNPKAFAELAKKYSSDPGSAEKGGDLDFFSRGAMVKSFEDTAFALKLNEISNPVESDFGYHIIMLTGVRGGQVRGFDAVKAELADEVKTGLAQQRYTELAEQFTNLVYEQADSLQPVVDGLKLPLRTANDVTRTPAAGTPPPLGSQKFIEALFASDAVHNKRNTQAVETGPNQLVSGRIVKYDPARKLPLADVKAKVREALVASMAADLARKDGEARVAALKAAAPGTPPITGGDKVISRALSQGYPRQVIDIALGVDPVKLPAFAGVELGNDGYAVVQVDKVLPRDPKLADPAAAQAQFAQVWGAAEMQAYYDALKARQKVQILATSAASSGADSPAR